MEQERLVGGAFGVDAAGFERMALEIFRFQYRENVVYRQFVQALGREPGRIDAIGDIPFLPISFFKTHAVRTTAFSPALVFESSGTTGAVTSRHEVRDVSLYERSFGETFRRFYGPISDYCVLALLPAYLEREGSSLVYMADRLIAASGHPQSGFYLYDFDKLAATLVDLESRGQRVLLLGVAFALLDFAEAFPMPLRHTIVMETGGMKGRKKEITRAELHAVLQAAWQIPAVHSEYGMTELLSQAYSAGDGIFHAPAWMRAFPRDENDPLTTMPSGEGILNIVDLANLYSCSFIATEDAGRVHADGTFEVLGRTDHSDARGCSLLLLPREGDPL